MVKKKKTKAKKTAKKTTRKPAKKATRKTTKKTTKKAAKKTTKRAAKKTTKKTTTKKTTAKTTGPRVTANIKTVAKNVKKARTKSDTINVLAQCCGMSRQEINTVLDNLSQLINMDLKKTGPGLFSIPGLMKIVTVHKPATKARKGINPFTKEPTIFKAKPAKNVVKVRVLKGLKDMV